MKRLASVATIVAVCFAVPAAAQQSPSSSPPNAGCMNMGMMSPSPSDTPATKEFKAVRMKMMQDMQAPLSGDADIDFMRQMRSHHQQAVEMAKIEKDHGKDAQVRELATSIMDQQTEEIAIIDRWLAAKGKQ